MSNFACGCLFDKKVKEPTFRKTKYFEDLSASFAINAKNEQLSAHYSWLVELHKPINGSQLYVEATLENPDDKTSPLQVQAIELQNNESMLPFEHRRFYVLSPSLPKLSCGLYNMKLTAYSDKSKKEKITEHSNQILSRVNTDNCCKSEFMEQMNAAARASESGWETKQ
ncbi:hypothetical protein K450DRAFT_239868 [Umbelopsis ramanniana AG]|uniref:Uncharacterized protein n=1 Tax=Umbelopsis ramanniana AG TaxID=1314678 RepID=A0AAD5HFF2_UMBRA|nr:uncharacterized protein K450DRAFT_239868 [Umbelopsis ramanniana AG]KAI8579948.1 hypothetical protein K450DRAFT_239868 [Umbelopsis ramanniana AG]